METLDHPSPNFEYRDTFLDGIKKLFSLFLTDADTQKFLTCALIIRNSKTLLSGGYGSGKNTFVEASARMFFGNEIAITRCHQELTTLDILWNIDVQKYLSTKQGAVTPRPLITAPLKYINEIQRLNVQCQNALLVLLAERVIHFGDALAETPDYVCFVDQNPHDIGCVGLVKALLDRLDYFLNVKYIGMKETHDLLRTKYEGRHVEDLRTLVPSIMSATEMKEIWKDVERITVDVTDLQRISMLAVLLRECVKVDRSVASIRYRLICEGCPYNGQICSQMERPLGHRWVDSAIKMAKACAWIEQKTKVSFNDILWAISYILPHRLELKQNVFSKHASETIWVKAKLLDDLATKLPLWDEGIKLFEQVGKGDQDAKRRLADLKIQDISLSKLYEWATSGTSTGKLLEQEAMGTAGAEAKAGD